MKTFLMPLLLLFISTANASFGPEIDLRPTTPGSLAITTTLKSPLLGISSMSISFCATRVFVNSVNGDNSSEGLSVREFSRRVTGCLLSDLTSISTEGGVTTVERLEGLNTVQDVTDATSDVVLGTTDSVSSEEKESVENEVYEKIKGELIVAALYEDEGDLASSAIDHYIEINRTGTIPRSEVAQRILDSIE